MSADKQQGQDGHGQDKQVSIHIDKTEYKSPTPTTGQALYTLGKVPAGYDLYREIHGKGDDELISNTTASVNLKDGDHFFSNKQTFNPGGRD